MKRILIDFLSSYIRTAVVEDGELTEIIIESKSKKFSIGNIYTGIIRKILPSQFAFVDIGASKNTFLYLNDKKEEKLYKYNEHKQKNELTIKQGQQIIVQMIKEAIGEKGAVVTTQLSFTGKYAVLMYNENSIGVSKKIDDEEKRKELIEIAKKYLKDNYGLIMRTNCKDISENEISDEISKLMKLCKDIVEKGKYSKAPSIIYSAKYETEKIMNDYILYDNDEIIINDINEFNLFMDINNDEIIKKIKLYDNNIPMFEYYFIEKQIEKALHNKIWLKSGGFIIIEQTEAFNIIDVNTGKFTGKNHRQTVLKTNEEAAFEIAKQIKLRNLSGMIIIDFIDMIFEDDRNYIYKILTIITKKDRINTNVVGMTQLGLMQLTRKKLRQPLSKILLHDCLCCNGVGKVESSLFITDKIKNQISSIFAQTIYNEVVLSAGTEIIDTFIGNNNEYKIIEKKHNGRILFNIINTQKYNYYNIEKRINKETPDKQNN